MKKIIAAVLLSAFCFAGCTQQQQTPSVTTEPTEGGLYLVTDYQVASPLTYPDYTFDHAPTTDELRQMAVNAMKDMLSVQWCVDRYFHYNKTSTGSGKDYSFIPENTYGGMPYTNADGSIVQWFEFYDPDTGYLVIEGDTQLINDYVGNTCAGCVCAAWQTVCNSIEGNFGTSDMVPMYGFIPVGGYVSPTDINNFSQYPTDQILEDNGKETMFACYAQVLPADSLVSTPDVHAIMVIEAANVSYKADGSIDPDASYITIQDQRNGQGSGFYNTDIDGQTVYCSGRLYHEYSFTELWNLGYIPVTTAEFMGTETYEAPEVTFEGNSADLKGISQGYITSNYPVCVAKMVLVDEEGNETLVERVLLDKRDLAIGIAQRFPIAHFLTSIESQSFKALLEEGKTYTLRYVVAVSNAQSFTVAEAPVTG